MNFSASLRYLPFLFSHSTGIKVDHFTGDWLKLQLIAWKGRLVRSLLSCWYATTRVMWQGLNWLIEASFVSSQTLFVSSEWWTLKGLLKITCLPLSICDWVTYSWFLGIHLRRLSILTRVKHVIGCRKYIFLTNYSSGCKFTLKLFKLRLTNFYLSGHSVLVCHLIS